MKMTKATIPKTIPKTLPLKRNCRIPKRWLRRGKPKLLSDEPKLVRLPLPLAARTICEVPFAVSSATSIQERRNCLIKSAEFI